MWSIPGCWHEASSALSNLTYLLQLVSHFIKRRESEGEWGRESDLTAEPECLCCLLVLSWCQGKNDQSTSDTFQVIQDIPVPLLPGLSSFSTSLQQSPPSAGTLLICKGKWSNIKEIYLQTCIREIEEIFSCFMYPRLYTSLSVSLRGSTPKFVSKTPSTVPVSIHSWTRNNERQKTYMLQKKRRKRKKNIAT